MICRKLLESSFNRARRLRWASRSWTRRFLRFWGESCAMILGRKIIIQKNQVERSFCIAVRKCVQMPNEQREDFRLVLVLVVVLERAGEIPKQWEAKGMPAGKILR